MEALPRAKQGPCAYAQVKAIHSIRENGTPARTANKPSLRPLWVGQPPVSDNKSLRYPSHECRLAKKGASGGSDCRLRQPTVVDTKRGREPRTTKCHWGQTPPGMDRKAHRPKPWRGQNDRDGRTSPRPPHASRRGPGFQLLHLHCYLRSAPAADPRYLVRRKRADPRAARPHRRWTRR